MTGIIGGESLSPPDKLNTLGLLKTLAPSLLGLARTVKDISHGSVYVAIEQLQKSEKCPKIVIVAGDSQIILPKEELTATLNSLNLAENIVGRSSFGADHHTVSSEPQRFARLVAAISQDNLDPSTS